MTEKTKNFKFSGISLDILSSELLYKFLSFSLLLVIAELDKTY